MDDIAAGNWIDFDSIYRDAFCGRFNLTREQLADMEQALQTIFDCVQKLCEAVCQFVDDAFEVLLQIIQSGECPWQELHPPRKLGGCRCLMRDRRTDIMRYRNAARGGL